MDMDMDLIFYRIFQNENLHLPIEWDGDNFYECLKKLFNEYCQTISETTQYNTEKNYTYHIKRTCNLIMKSVKHYLDGFPAKAYNSFTRLMAVLQERPLRIYLKSHYEMLGGYNDKLNLFRVSSVNNYQLPYARTRIFHTPYNLRAKISTNRYSIAGYPSLYLGTCLKLCCEEVKYDRSNGLAIASKFKVERNIEANNTIINVLELALKPQDFYEHNSYNFFNQQVIDKRVIDNSLLTDNNVKTAYLLWYPLIAACSFIRANTDNAFTIEYIVPQLLMQWVRNVMGKRENLHKLIGIRYFSCASKRASDLGFNYVFPVSGEQISSQLQYCPILTKSFRLTNPLLINDYLSIKHCEEELINNNNLNYIDV